MAKSVTTTQRRPSSRSKRDAILAASIELFGREGYETGKWSDVADAVGIGSTALYHYFESKVHCLYVIMADALQEHRDEFEATTKGRTDFEMALDEALRGGFDLTEHEVFRMRVLVAEQGLVGVPRKSDREEAARELARDRMRQLELSWATFLVRGMENGTIAEADPTLLARAILGLYTSVWHWYRPGGPVALAEVTEFFVKRQRAMVGLPMESPTRAAAAAVG